MYRLLRLVPALFATLAAWGSVGHAQDFTGHSGRYKIMSIFSGKAVDLADFSTDNGGNIMLWNDLNGVNQQWDFANLGSGYFSILSAHSGKAMEAYDWCTADGCEVRQWDYWGGEPQQWQPIDMGWGNYKLRNRYNNLLLDVWGYDANAGADLRQWSDVNGINQYWRIITPCGAGTPDASVTGAPGAYYVNGTSVGDNYLGAILQAISSVGTGQRVTVYADGSIGDSYIALPSNITFEVCGTMNVGYVAGHGAIEAISQSNVYIPHLKMTGSPYFGLRFADDQNLHLGHIELNMSGGLGIRFDRDLPGSTNVVMEYVYVNGTGNHGVETWNVDGLLVGAVVARNTAYAGLLLNNTRNASIGLVYGENTATGTGYATLRFANTNGQIDGAWPSNIYVDRVISIGGGRGLFCVSNSGGATVNHIEFSNNGNNSILLENCHNVAINGGTINGGGEVRIAARSEFPNSSDINISNLTITDTGVTENPCGDNVNFSNITVVNGSYNVCN